MTAFRTALDGLDSAHGVESSGWFSSKRPHHHLRVVVRGADGAPLFDLEVIDRWAYLLLHDVHVREFPVADPGDVETLLNYLDGALSGG